MRACTKRKVCPNRVRPDIEVHLIINDSSPHQSSQKVKRTHTKLLWENGFRVK